MNHLELDDLEIDEEEKYSRKLESGLYSLQLIPVTLGHLWTSERTRMRARIQLLLKQNKLAKKDVKDILKVSLSTSGDFVNQKDPSRFICFLIGILLPFSSFNLNEKQ